MISPPSFLPKRQPGPDIPSDDPYCMGESAVVQLEHCSGLAQSAEEVSSGRALTQSSGGCARLLIADDAPIVRDGLRNLIESQPELCVAGESSVGNEVVDLARTLKPDLLLLGLDMPQGSGLEVLNNLASLYPPIRILVLVGTVEESSIVEAFYLGARGIVLRGSSREVLLASIRSVIGGQYWLDGESVPILIEALRRPVPSQKVASPTRDYGLTPHELKIVRKLANAASNKEMGQELSISERTVKHHLTNIFNKLGISSRVELAVFALKNGLIRQEDSDARGDWGRSPDSAKALTNHGSSYIKGKRL
jgi:two-component system, NarL family, nitrate/nitrite response regulator NarL